MIDGKSYTAADLMATTLTALGIDINKKHTSKSGRPIKMANGGSVIKELILNVQYLLKQI